MRVVDRERRSLVDDGTCAAYNPKRRMLTGMKVRRCGSGGGWLYHACVRFGGTMLLEKLR